MPTTYAHWRFGCDCIQTLPENLKNIVLANRELFDIGVHGPDIFFYDLKHPELPEYGSTLHAKPAREFFEQCINVYNNNEDKDKMLSYILGVLSHYAFDSAAHCYVNTKEAKTPGTSHNLIEAEYDAHLIRKDNKKVYRTDRARSLKPNKERAEIISRFYPFNSDQILNTTKMQRLIIKAYNCKTNLKRNAVAKILLKKNKKNYADLIVYPHESQLCKDSNLRLDKLKDKALENYPKLVDSFMNSLDNPKLLSVGFDECFDIPADTNVPVLSYEEELNYKI